MRNEISESSFSPVHIIMHYLSDEEAAKAVDYIKQAGAIALSATCTRSKCGSIIVKDDVVLGTGYNSPPKHLESARRCDCDKKSLDPKVTDKTCCMHAEQRAIMDTLKHHPDAIEGSRLYFVRLGENNEPKFSREPYCTICSKMSLDAGIKEFVLYHKEGICVYDTEEYNTLSLAYKTPA